MGLVNILHVVVPNTWSHTPGQEELLVTLYLIGRLLIKIHCQNGVFSIVTNKGSGHGAHDVDARNTTSLLLVMARVAAMKKVLSQISDTRIKVMEESASVKFYRVNDMQCEE